MHMKNEQRDFLDWSESFSQNCNVIAYLSINRRKCHYFKNINYNYIFL